MNLPTNPTAQAVDSVLIYIFGFSLILLLGITVVTLYFVIKYRRSKYPEPTSEVHGNFWLETVWTVLPTIIVLTMFWYGWTNYLGLRNVPEGAMEIKATARMWSWQFEYPDGRKERKLYVPVGTPIKITMTSVDVLHSFFVPAFRIKRDTVPGMESRVWFEATEPGSYDIFCAEYCGVGHADMMTSVEALSVADYAAWLKPAAEVTAAPPKLEGRQLLEEYGCLGCHSEDGSQLVGPSFKGIGQRKVRIDRDGTDELIKVDRDYLIRAIKEPSADIVEDYPPIMPAGDYLSDEEIDAIVEHLLKQ